MQSEENDGLDWWRTIKRTTSNRSGTYKRKLKAKLFSGRHIVRCCFCRIRLSFETSTLEHIVPRACAGGWKLENLTLSCSACNSERGMTEFEEYLALKRGKVSAT